MALPLCRSISLYILLLLNGQSYQIKLECSKKSLTQLHIVFRHGNKTLEGTYPADPHKNETYYPFGKGQLTNSGKLLGYQTGRYLKERYKEFLGSYTFESLEAYSSPSWRCKAYLQVIMAGLYSADKSLEWHSDLNWDPKPFDENCSLCTDIFLRYASCPNFLRTYEQHKKSFQYLQTMSPYGDVIKYLDNNSGLVSQPFFYGTAIFLHGSFTSQEEWGLALPPWSKGYWPELIWRIAALEWTQIYARKVTKILGAGFLISKIVKDAYAKINRSNEDSVTRNRKIYLYVGHELNIYGILAWLGVLEPVIINYGSYIIFEIHNLNGDHYIRILHQNAAITSTSKPIQIPNCGYCCKFEDFVRLYEGYFDPEGVCG